MAGKTRTSYFPLGGGLDVVSPALSVLPGFALGMINYEPWYNGGYRRIPGFERMDGRAKPSAGTFTGFKVSTVAGLTLGVTVTGGTSGATGVVCGIWDDDGTYGADSIGVTRVTGIFVNGETITGGGSRVIGSGPSNKQSPNQDLEDEWLLYAQNHYRASILVVPGAGQVRGIWQRGANRWAWRNNVGSTLGIMHKASAAGWVTTGITRVHTIYFDAGGGGGARALPQPGQTVTGFTSGATGVVHRLIEHGGATASNDAYGYLALITVTGTFQDNEQLRVGGTSRGLADGVATQFTFAPNGHYRFTNHNFLGGSNTYRTYGVSGVGPAFEIDESEIVTPLLLPASVMLGQPASNQPFLIEEHANTLFLAFLGGSLQMTVPGSPLVMNGFLGAAEFGIGDEITGLNSVVGQVLVISSERNTQGLFGNPATVGTADQDIQLKLIGNESGAKLYTAQKIDTVYSLDDLGISSVTRSDVFGDFMGSTISQLVQPIVTALRNFVTDSTIVRESNQYRVYFGNGDALVMYVPAPGADGRTGGNRVQFGFLNYPFTVRRIYNTDDENGIERTYFASDDGFVYEDQIGTNFDGDPISSYVRTAFHHVGTPAYRKRFRRADLELNSSRSLQLQFVSDISYGASEVSSGLDEMMSVDVPELDVFAGGGFWDSSNWDEFLWDGQSLSTARANLTGTGENVGFLIYNSSASAKPFILQGITLHFDLRRLQR